MGVHLPGQSEGGAGTQTQLFCGEGGTCQAVLIGDGGRFFGELCVHSRVKESVGDSGMGHSLRLGSSLAARECSEVLGAQLLCSRPLTLPGTLGGSRQSAGRAGAGSTGHRGPEPSMRAGARSPGNHSSYVICAGPSDCPGCAHVAPCTLSLPPRAPPAAAGPALALVREEGRPLQAGELVGSGSFLWTDVMVHVGSISKKDSASILSKKIF